MDTTESDRNASALTASIQAQFPSGFHIEVYVLSEAGTAAQIFSGPTKKLKPGDFKEILTSPGMLYLFSVAGIPQKLVDIPDMVKDQGKKIQFCWITAPSPPVLVKRGSRDLGLQWQSLKACGMQVQDGNEDLLQYVLEGSQGEQFHRGVPPTTLHPRPGADFKVIGKGKDLLSITVEGLDASYWYYWRVVFEYGGARFESPPVAINTVGGVPLIPKTPVVEIEKFPGPMLEKRTSVEYRVILSWPPAEYVGASIEKYMIQLHELSISLNDTEKESMAPGVMSPKSIMYRQLHKIAIDENIEQTLQEKDVQTSRWRTVYCDSANRFSLKAPPLGTLQWNFRLRAKNCHGWSDDWVCFYINAKSHPAIFPAGKHFDPRRYVKTAPAMKEPSQILQTQPSTATSAPSTAPTNGSPSLDMVQHDREVARTAGGVNHSLTVFASVPEADEEDSVASSQEKEPRSKPPRGLRQGQIGVQQSTDTSSLWLDDARSLDIQSSSVDVYQTDEEKLQKLADSEVTRVVDRVPVQYSLNKDSASDIIGTPFISSYVGDDFQRR